MSDASLITSSGSPVLRAISMANDGARLTDGELEQGLHLVTVVEHGAVDHALVVVGKVLQVLIVGGDDAKGLLLPELLQYGLGNGAANHGLCAASKLIY